jgi:cation diffusion facilitator CzcD-associated flavoprotein CzcO
MGQSKSELKYDVIVVGAGFGGLYALHRFRKQGLRVTVIEAASDLGGTWYWNRYPGARCDVPSIEYSYGFSEELQTDWNWTEVMAGQPEILRYANHVAERFDLRRDIRFDTRVRSAEFDESQRSWRIETDAGESFETRFCVMATGCLSTPNTPPIEGADDFAGDVYHTGRWPHQGVDFSGRNVGIIGTGSSGIQSIPVIAEQARNLTVFQRTPNYTMPAHNQPLTREFLQKAKRNYPDIRRQQRESLAGIIGFGFGFGGSDPLFLPTESLLSKTIEERKAALDSEGFGALRNYEDIHTNLEANELGCEMYREQVSRIIHDAETADGLMPRDYPLGCKRPVIDTNYYETFNRDNVKLVDLRRGGIEHVTATGVQTKQGHFDCDALVWATGFDAMTGSLLRIDIRGRNGRRLQVEWHAGPRTFLGLQICGFPNLFTITGPGSPSVLSNMFVSIEQHVEWIGDCMAYLQEHRLETIEAKEEAVEEWIEHVNEVSKGTMFTAPSCHSWYLGANIEGKPRIFMPYVGGVGVYREKCDEIAKKRYEGFQLD